MFLRQPGARSLRGAGKQRVIAESVKMQHRRNRERSREELPELRHERRQDNGRGECSHCREEVTKGASARSGWSWSLRRNFGRRHVSPRTESELGPTRLAEVATAYRIVTAMSAFHPLQTYQGLAEIHEELARSYEPLVARHELRPPLHIVSAMGFLASAFSIRWRDLQQP